MNGEELHKKAEAAREAGSFLEALNLCDEAAIAFAKEGNSVKLADICASRALTLRHIAADTGNNNFLILSKYAAKAGVKIIEKSGSDEGKAIPLYTLGKVYESLEKWEDAQEEIMEAIESVTNLPKTMVAEMKTRLDSINYRMGDSNALESFKANIEDLINGDFEDDYVKNVWISGAYMHMAEALFSKGEKDQAKEMLGKARTIIDSDARMTLRSKQLAKIDSELS